MDTTLTINLAKPIKSAKISGDYSNDTQLPNSSEINSTANTEQVKLMQDLKAQKNLYSELCQTLQGLMTKLNQLYDTIFTGQKEEITRLSLEIAKKILMQKIQKGDYEIEPIIKEALKNAPTHEDLVVHLNPDDLAQYQKAQQDGGSDTLAGIKLVADSKIGRAECVLETPKGIIKSLIDEHLEQIGKALENAE